MSAPRSNKHLRWPAERFYWALLDTSLLPRWRRGARRRLEYLVEAELPVPLEQVHTVYRRLPGERCLAVGVDRTRLQSVPIDALTLAPEILPEFIDTAVKPERLNFLTGGFEPLGVRALRERWRAGMIAILILCAAGAVLGMQRRGEQARVESTRLRQATIGLLEQVVGSIEGSGAAADLARARLRLRGRLEELRRTRPADLPGGAMERADLTLDAFLRAWPRDLEARIETATVTGSVVAIAGEVVSTDDAQRLSVAMESVPGWRSQQPEVETVPGGVRIGLRLMRETEGRTP